MMIQREDLLAAAAAGLLQYRQIDPLLIYLLQRDVRARRAAMQGKPKTGALYAFLGYVAAVLAVITIALFALVYAAQGSQAPDIGMVLLFALIYAVAAVWLASWFHRRGPSVPVRIVSALMLALAPLAVFAL